MATDPHEAAMDICPDPMDDALRMFWMCSPLCAKYLVRNQLWTALWFIESRRTLFLKAWRLAHAPYALTVRKIFSEIKEPQSLAVKEFENGVPGRIRTCDAGIRRPALRGLRCLPDALQSLCINGFVVS